MVYTWTKKLHKRLFPPRCRLCRAPGVANLELCAACRAELPWLTHRCARCALPLRRESGISLCNHCINAPPPLDACDALFDYRGPVDGWIRDLKFAQDLAAARLLGGLLAGRIAEDRRGPPATLVPVPLHRKRLAQRGYNQALEIARALCEQGYRLDVGCCRRRRTTSPQSDLPASERRGNVRNAFSVSRLPAGGRLVLIDDVMTTGATLHELARSFKRAGAERVEAWVIARTGVD